MGASLSERLLLSFAEGDDIIGCRSGQVCWSPHSPRHPEQKTVRQVGQGTAVGRPSEESGTLHTDWHSSMGHQALLGSSFTSRSNFSRWWSLACSSDAKAAISESKSAPDFWQLISGQVIGAPPPSTMASWTYCCKHAVQKMHWQLCSSLVAAGGCSIRQSLQKTSGTGS